jgi:hypothetical protein
MVIRRPRLGPRSLLAHYTNYFEVGHNAYEFLIDFGQYQPESASVRRHTRIVTGPSHVKLLAHMLDDAIAKHEAEHGPIAEIRDPIDPPEILLRSLPDFERRAVRTRGGDAAPRPTTPTKREPNR